MIACTSPGFTVRSRPLRIFLPSISTCRFLISSSGISQQAPSALFNLVQPHLDGGNTRVIVLLDRHDASQMSADRSHLGAHRVHPIGHSNHIASDRPQIVWLDHYPTLPSRLTEMSFCASTANSIGSCCSTSLTKPSTTSAVASSAESPRCWQ